MTGDSFDKRVPSFIQFTDAASSRRPSKRRSPRLQKGTQQSNKKRKKDTSPTKQHRIPPEENDTDHQQISPINNQDSVTVKKDACDTLDHIDHKTLPISNDKTDDDEEAAEENDSSDVCHLEQISPISNNNRTNKDAVTEEGEEENSSALPSHRQQIDSPISHHEKNIDDEHQQRTSPEPSSHQGLPLHSFSMPRKTVPITAVYTQHLEFNTITLSPDHGRKIIIPPSSPLPPKITSAAAVLDSPQKLTGGTTRPTTPSHPATEENVPQASPSITKLPPAASPSSSSPSPTTVRKLLLAPPTSNPLDTLVPLEPCEFYTPNTDHQQADDDETDGKATTQDDTYGWEVTMRIKSFFDRIKTVLR